MADFKLNIKPVAVEVDESLKLKQQVTQVNERAVSELVFNTGNADVDKDLGHMFKLLEIQKQAMFEGNGGDGSIKNLFVTILNKTKHITDHKILPDEAIQLMFTVGTTVALDHTLLKDTKMTQEEMKMKAATRVLDASMSAGDDILAELMGKVNKNNKAEKGVSKLPNIESVLTTEGGSSTSVSPLPSQPEELPPTIDPPEQSITQDFDPMAGLRL